MFLSVILATALTVSDFLVDPAKAESCPDGQQHFRTSIRHIERGGIGYETGYSTLEVFLASDPSQWVVTPFFDARGHIFDNGKWAANAGLGLRALWGNRAYGINTYYDYRNAGHFQSNQIGVGLETLGQLFDFRINGYLPVGAKTSGPYDPTFAYFSGNYMYISQKSKSAMKGADAEFGFHFGKPGLCDFYAAAGPYYYIGEIDPVTWGGKARLLGVFKDILTLEISDSYDRTFQNKFQGQIGLSFSFGPKSKIKKENRTCKLANTLNSRMLQPVGRQEIIVIDKTKKKSVAIDPATGLPYLFVFVNNTGSSNGTYASPYHSFAQVEATSSPNDIIYVFPGDGTTAGMDSGIVLKANQKLWGSGIAHLIQTTAGTISIPAQSSTSPTITNTDVSTNGDAITLATNNAISGFTVTSTLNDGIIGTDAQSLNVSSCTFTNINTFPIQATFSGDAAASITNNQFLNNVNGIVLNLNGASNVVCSSNTFQGQTSSSEMPIRLVSNNNTLTAQINNNLFDDNFTGSIRFDFTSLANADLTLLNNTITNNRAGAIGANLGSSIVILQTGTTNHCAVVMESNTISGNISNSFYVDPSGKISTFEISASGNTMSNNGGSAITSGTQVDTFTLTATNNTINQLNDNGISVTGGTPFQTANITISNNTIRNITNSQSAIAIAQGSSTLNFTAKNNTIDNCEGTGMLFFSSEFTNMTANITGNEITNCQNLNANAGSGISLDTYVNLTSSVINNDLSNDATPGVAIGLFTGGNPNVCLRLSGNSGNLDPVYSLTNPGAGVFNLSPCNVDSINTGMIAPSGTISNVQSCSDPTPCPP
ncbi:MAG: inverse autotransporter beta domain-containing protein [Verrucomicrobia bacterium]|nr:inverse autotransporter beta domain-containing protein [Verrucomicrobiota bacterium]